MDKLPPGYRDNGDFRKAFSAVKPPAYCHITMVKGVIQDWGLVEFPDHEDTEETVRRLRGAQIGGSTAFRVHYCVPGVNAIDIYMKAMNAPAENKKKALLNDTPSANVYSQLQKLAQQNPNCE